MNKYDHTKLAVGDVAAYGCIVGYGNARWDVQLSTVDRFTTTQIVLKDGTKFRRSNGERIGEKSSGYYTSRTHLLDPKGTEVEQAWVYNQGCAVRDALTAMAKRPMRTMDDFADYLARIQSVVNTAQLRRAEWTKEFGAK